jgi:pimeloyl-ACP methyl ester carboxylesterase
MDRHLLDSPPERPAPWQAWLQNAERRQVRGADGVMLSCWLTGRRGARPVILTSGIGCGPVFMSKVASELARDHRVVYWDYRGHGTSERAPAEGGYRIRDHARDLDFVVSAFAASERPLMVGFSMGVQVSIEWTQLRPARALGHVYLLGLPRNPMYRTVVLRRRAARLTEGFAHGAAPLLQLIGPATRAAVRTPFTYLLARSLGVVRPGCSRAEFSDFVRYASAVPLDVYLQCAAGLLEHDASEAFGRIREPVLMLAGEHDVLIDPEECRSFAARLPSARFELLCAAGHAGSLEYGTYLAKRVRAFVRALAKSESCAA